MKFYRKCFKRFQAKRLFYFFLLYIFKMTSDQNGSILNKKEALVLEWL